MWELRLAKQCHVGLNLTFEYLALKMYLFFVLGHNVLLGMKHRVMLLKLWDSIIIFFIFLQAATLTTGC